MLDNESQPIPRTQELFGRALTETDFSDGDTKNPILITVHFTNLTPYDRQEFDSNLIDGALIVTRRLSLNPSEHGRFFVSAYVNPEFTECRNEEGKTKKREAYGRLREKYADLSKERNADEIDGFLEGWEENHRESLKLEQVSGFKGWKNVAVGKLKERTDYIFIRAVQDATKDLQQSKNSPVKILINTIARQTIENNVDFQKFMSEANQKIATFTDPANVPALSEISSELTSILKTYYKNSEIIANWVPIETIQPSFPSSELEIKDNEFVTSIDGVGHGLQRAVILTVLQYMAERRIRGDKQQVEKFPEPQSDIILAIEEPEAYQHPVKQRLFARIMRKLTDGFNDETGIRIQIIFATHSPIFVSLPDCSNIRLVRYVSSKKNVVVSTTSLSECARSSALLDGRDEREAWTAEQMAAKLHIFKDEIAEGFFSKCVVLVEGAGDKAFLFAFLKVTGRDPYAEGVVIAEAGGKSNLVRPIIIFRGFGIPCYWIFDNDSNKSGADRDKSVRENRALQRACNIEADACVDFPVGVTQHCASWEGNLENYVRSIAGDQFGRTCESVSLRFGVAQSDCLKSPGTAAVMLQEFLETGVRFEELEKISAAIHALVDRL